MQWIIIQNKRNHMLSCIRHEILVAVMTWMVVTSHDVHVQCKGCCYESCTDTFSSWGIFQLGV